MSATLLIVAAAGVGAFVLLPKLLDKAEDAAVEKAKATGDRLRSEAKKQAEKTLDEFKDWGQDLIDRGKKGANELLGSFGIGR